MRTMVPWSRRGFNLRFILFQEVGVEVEVDDDEQERATKDTQLTEVPVTPSEEALLRVCEQPLFERFHWMIPFIDGLTAEKFMGPVEGLYLSNHPKYLLVGAQ